jgi:septum site-determining protein MinD
VIPESDEVVISTNRGTPLVHDRGSRAGQAFRKIAARLNGESVPLDDDQGDGLLGRMKRFFKS